MKIKAGLLALSLAFTSFLAACGSESTSGNDNSEVKDDALQIYTTIYPLQDFAAKIGGEHVNVESILPPGVDAHTFEPTPKTMVNLAKADAFIYSGAGVEGFVEAAKDTLKSEDVKLVEAAHGIELAHHDEHGTEETHDEHATEENHDEHATEENHDEHDHGDVDPHIWLDPVLAIELAENIKTELTELKPEAKEDFEKNFETLKSDLETLDKEFAQVIESAPKKEILVAHAAYGYWEERYGIHQLSVSGLSPTNEPSQKELQDLVSTAKEHDIKYVIFEQNAAPKIAELVKSEIGADSLALHNLEAVTEDDIQNKEDYFSIMKKNLETLKTALQ
ncbi:MAG TPA: zinc ABC transporter substrate-binding protein [Bacillus sp. (in: firmicutes)]|nr:zinc ABC transporter substrate-binding protein [Bacillus sp. (in: firmicutes)]